MKAVNLRDAARITLGFILGALLTTASLGQVQEQSVSQLIASFSRESGSSGKPDLAAGPECADAGRVQSERRAARTIARLGDTAIHGLNSALDSIEARGYKSEFWFNAQWLLYAYGTAGGRGAFPRLLRMVGNPNLISSEPALDTAIALSLHLTSYADDFRVPGVQFCRLQEPRDALDHLILSWERNDQRSFEESLGPQGRDAIALSGVGRTWTALRAQMWRAKSEPVAVGYRFEIAGAWSQPEENLDDTISQERQPVIDLSKLPRIANIDAEFTNKDGSDCGHYIVEFVLGQNRIMRSAYLVNNLDLEGLLGVISSCAAE